MADISKITLPNGTTYDVKDSTARSTASGKSTVSIDRKISTGTNIFDITIDNTTTQIYAPSGGGGENFPIGSVYMTSTYDNPSSYLGGTWALIDKEFRTENEAAKYTRNTTNTSAATIMVNRRGHDIIYHGTVTFKVQISNTNLEVFTQTMSNNGATTFTFAEEIVFIGQCDSANALILMDMDVNGRVRTLSVVIRGTGTSVAANNTVSFDVIVPCNYLNMVNSFCDKFYWKRTA